MKPDRTNYEIWIIDYLDGNLDSSRTELLLTFLEQNPDILNEFEEISKFSLKPGYYKFDQKDLLRKKESELSETQFELLCVAAMENDLSPEQHKELEEMASLNPERQRTRELISKIRLKPPETEFRQKYKLRRLTVRQKVIRYSTIGLTAAATFLIMISIITRHENG